LPVTVESTGMIKRARLAEMMLRCRPWRFDMRSWFVVLEQPETASSLATQRQPRLPHARA
jgi:hypothetical protein